MVILWARLAQIAGEYLKKGKPAFIEGRLQLDTWDDKQTGQKRSRREFSASSTAANSAERSRFGFRARGHAIQPKRSF